MSMYESAEKINIDLQNLFSSIPIEQFTSRQREMILDIIIRFGAVAKFRCRSNTAYDNFVNACLKNIATTERVKYEENSEFTVLKATIKVN